MPENTPTARAYVRVSLESCRSSIRTCNILDEHGTRYFTIDAAVAGSAIRATPGHGARFQAP